MPPAKSQTFTREANTIIERYLRKVKTELESMGLTDTETELSIRELKTHIIEMCKLKSREEVITTDVVEKTLKKLGTPEQITSVLKPPQNGDYHQGRIMETPEEIGKSAQSKHSSSLLIATQMTDLSIIDYLGFTEFIRGLILILNTLGILPMIIIWMTYGGSYENAYPLPTDRFVVIFILLGMIVAMLISLYALIFVQVIGDAPPKEAVGVKGIEADSRNVFSFLLWLSIFFSFEPFSFDEYVLYFIVLYNTLALGVFSGIYMISRIRLS